MSSPIALDPKRTRQPLSRHGACRAADPQQPPEPYRAVSRSLWQWLFTGLALMAVFPAARSHSDWLGWLPFWLSIAPTISLAVLHRYALTRRLARPHSARPALSFKPKPPRTSQARRLAQAKAAQPPHLRAA